MPDATDSQLLRSVDADPLIGSLVAGRYRVCALLGEGGMGQVYRAIHEAIEKPIALKILRPEYSQKREIVTRFHQEAVSASRIKHPNVLDVFDFGQLDNGRFFLAMELLVGQDLAEELVSNRTIAPARCVQIGVQIAKALAAAHVRGVVHRDLKPENVFLHRTSNNEELVKIVDFGIAQLRTNEDHLSGRHRPRRITRAGMIFGTPEYMAPEQAEGRNADFRADIYSLGIMLYEMLCGAVPFTGTTFMGVLSAQINDPVPPLRSFCDELDSSPQLESLVFTMLNKDPSERPQGMSAVVMGLADTPEARTIHSASLDLFALSSDPSFQPGEAGFGSQRSVPILRIIPPGSLAPDSALGTDPRQRAETLDHAGTLISRPTSSPVAVRADPRELHPTRDSGPLREPTSQANLETGASIRRLGVARSAWTMLPATATLAASAALFALALWWRESSSAVIDHAALAGSDTGPPQANSAESVSPMEVGSRVSATVPQRNVPVDLAGPSVAAPSAAVSSPPEPLPRIHLEVNTTPAGAVVTMDGAQICSETPCSVYVARDQRVQLEARGKHTVGRVRVWAQNDQKVTIPLSPIHHKAATGLCDRFDANLGIKVSSPCPPR